MNLGREATSSERLHYAARCYAVRDERHSRAEITSAEAQAWQALLTDQEQQWTSLTARLGREHRRASQEGKQRFYVTQLHRNPHSPVPTVESIERGASPAQAALQRPSAETATGTAAPLDVQSDLLLWESENRSDLCEWERDERTAMAGIMAHILLRQLQRERREREDVGRCVLNGATVLEWRSYPSYSD